MDRLSAFRILGIEETSDKRIIKKKYRAIMHVVHPDAIAFGGEPAYEYSAHEINAAYEFLINSAPDKAAGAAAKSNAAKNRWNAPENEYAFTGRAIYSYAEGADGMKHGIFCVARGKYIRIPDEDQKMFLLSIYDLSRSLLDPYGDDAIRKYQAELAYLLLQQYTDPGRELERYQIDENLYYIPSMLETEGKRNRLKEGDVLYPAAVRSHRLYVKDAAGREVGYISFSDDMIYQTVVPLFEQRSVQVKIRVSGNTFGNNNVRKIVVKNLDLWIRFEVRARSEVTLTLSSRIRKLLEECACE